MYGVTDTKSKFNKHMITKRELHDLIYKYRVATGP